MNLEILLNKLSGPAKRAILSLGIKTIEDLSGFTNDQISKLHGIGPNAEKTIEKEMKTYGIKYKQDTEKKESPEKLKFKTIDEYIKTFPTNTRKTLTDMRNIIQKSAPVAKEKISYNMPAFEWNGILVYFAAYKNHLGFYPTSSGMKAYKDELTPYKFSKGAIQFPLNQPLPNKLISKIVKFRLEEHLMKKSKK